MIKLMVMLLVLAFAGLFFINGPDGGPVLTLGDLAPSSPEAGDAAPQTQQVYKWQDENGVWQFSDQAVDEARGETIELDGMVNVIQSYQPPPEATPARANGNSTTLNTPGITTVNPAQINEMMNTVNDLQGTLDQRAADIDSLAKQK